MQNSHKKCCPKLSVVFAGFLKFSFFCGQCHRGFLKLERTLGGQPACIIPPASNSVRYNKAPAFFERRSQKWLKYGVLEDFCGLCPPKSPECSKSSPFSTVRIDLLSNTVHTSAYHSSSFTPFFQNVKVRKKQCLVQLSKSFIKNGLGGYLRLEQGSGWDRCWWEGGQPAARPDSGGPKTLARNKTPTPVGGNCSSKTFILLLAF